MYDHHHSRLMSEVSEPLTLADYVNICIFQQRNGGCTDCVLPLCDNACILTQTFFFGEVGGGVACRKAAAEERDVCLGVCVCLNACVYVCKGWVGVPLYYGSCRGRMTAVSPPPLVFQQSHRCRLSSLRQLVNTAVKQTQGHLIYSPTTCVSVSVNLIARISPKVIVIIYGLFNVQGNKWRKQYNIEKDKAAVHLCM